MAEWAVHKGDAYDLLAEMEPESVDLAITSPPYWGMRNYEQEHNWEILTEWRAEGNSHEDVPDYEWYRGHGGILGLEPMPEWYIANLAVILDMVRRALKRSGSLWLNIGDTYFACWSSIRPGGGQGMRDDNKRFRRKTPVGGFRQDKQLLLIPSRVAIALQCRRWILRNDLIWYKRDTTPCPFKDRLALRHEHFFHFARKPKQGRAKYYYDLAEAHDPPHDVMECPTVKDSGGHSAAFPSDLIRPRILSSCPPGGLVLDPFCGTGTTLRVAVESGRSAIGFDTNSRFISSVREQMA